MTLAQGLYYFAVVTCNRSEYEKSLGYLERAREADPYFIDAYILTATIYLRLRDTEQAEAWCKKALEVEATCSGIYQVLAQLRLPGPDYCENIRRIHDYLHPKTYLEIGVMYGNTLRLANNDTHAIGVDPHPMVEPPMGPLTKVYKETSDEFFASGILEQEFGEEPIDLAFIDGMHLFEYALRDFINVERHCADTSVVLIHDCLPLDRLTASRERISDFWSGDVWKLIICLKKYRPDLRINVIGTRPTGLAIITRLNPDSNVLLEHIDQLYDEFKDLDYEYVELEKDSRLNVIPNQWSVIERQLTS